jgi:hypothetical protein
VLALYLSSIDNRIWNGDYGVFSLQTAFSSKNFSGILGTMKTSGKGLLSHYLAIDILFSASCAITFPSAMALMFSQYKLILEESFKRSPSRTLSGILSLSFILAPFIAILTIVGNTIILAMMQSDTISNSMVFVESAAHTAKYIVLFVIIAFLIIFLIMKRMIIRTAYRQQG